MAGTNAAAVKRALVRILNELPELAGVQVAYSYPGRTVQREVIYLGQVTGTVALAAMRGGTRLKREEQLVLGLHIEVDIPGEDTTENTDARATEIGEVIETYLAGNPQLGGDVPGLLVASVQQIELDGGTADETASSVLSLAIELRSLLH